MLDMTQASDNVVLHFVTSRMDPQSYIAVLKRVAINFNRLKGNNGLDLSKEIRVLAGEAGIQLDTNFQYAPSTLQREKKHNFLSPSFMSLRGKESDYTWNSSFEQFPEFEG